MGSPSLAHITQGTIRRQFQQGGVTLTETVHGSHSHLPEHSHRAAALSLVLAGGFEERAGEDRFLCGALSVLFKPPDLPHSNRYGPAGARTLLVALEDEAFAQLGSHLPATPDRAIPIDRALAARALWLFAGDGDRIVDRDLDWEELFAEILDRTAASSGGDSLRPRWLKGVEERLEHSFAEPIRLSTLAEEAGVHPVHLARTYRRHHHCSIGDALRRRRMEHAVERLRSGVTDLARLALECGFSDQSHFARNFRREVGTSPGRFRRHALGLLADSAPGADSR
jgi:AraC family transcriptional regulator